MKAFLFAAGFGTRLKPLTNHCPKAMVSLNGKPLIEHAITKLKSANVDEIIVNVHHFAEQIIDYISTNNFGIPIRISDESEQLLDTGGGLLFAKNWLQNSSFIAYNVDIITSVNLTDLIQYHYSTQNLATLVVRQRKTSRYLMFDEKMLLSGWKNSTTNEKIISNQNYSTASPFAFSGIQIINPELFNLITETGKFSVTPMYIRLAKDQAIGGFIDHSPFWIDVGKPGQLAMAENYLNQQKTPE